jgi:predicted dehydrogenase
MSPIGMGVIGTGYMGRTYAACLTRHVPDGRLVAVWGGKRAPALAEEFGVEADESLAALLARPDVEAVVITSPHTAHRPQAEAAAAAGKHVYIEKPMSVSVADCDAIIAACDAAGVKLTVNFVTRFRHAPKAMKRLIDDGAIGEVRIVDEETGRVIIPAKLWAWDPAEGSQFLDWGVHETDALRWLTGSEVARVYAEYHTFGTPPPADLTAQVQVTMQNGVMAQMLMTYETPEPGLVPNDWTRVVGSKGIIEADHYGKVNLGDADGWRVADEQVAFNFLGDYLDPNRLEGFAAQVQDFAEAIQEGREPVVTGADGRAAVEIVEAADRSAATHQAVTLPLSG